MAKWKINIKLAIVDDYKSGNNLILNFFNGITEIKLSEGNDKMGLKHIHKRHSNDFYNKFQVEKSEEAISAYLKKFLSSGVYKTYCYNISKEKGLLLVGYEVDETTGLKVVFNDSGEIITSCPAGKKDLDKFPY